MFIRLATGLCIHLGDAGYLGDGDDGDDGDDTNKDQLDQWPIL